MAKYTDIVIKPNSNNKGNQNSRSNVYRGVSTVNPETPTFQSYDIELIKQDLINHFNIRKGEKIYRPQFGTGRPARMTASENCSKTLALTAIKRRNSATGSAPLSHKLA